MKKLIKNSSLTLLSLALATALWIPLVHIFFAPSEQEIARQELSPRAQGLLKRQLQSWKRLHDDPDRELLRLNNPEWDFMECTFFVLSLANLSIRDPESKAENLEVIDQVIDHTIELEGQHGFQHFLLGYWRRAPYVVRPARSLFVDGEIALMLGSRLLVEDNREYRSQLENRVNRIVGQMEQSPVLSGESYPDECWMFDNVTALVALKIADIVLEQDHSQHIRRWILAARTNLVDERTGLLVSEYAFNGRHFDGPEGSTIFYVAHALLVLDEEFARDQYQRARNMLGVDVMGFSYAREWPDMSTAVPDIDSGPVIPITGAGAGASGMAILASAAFDDREFFRRLLTSLDFAAFPIEGQDQLQYGASNQVGDAVLLYSLVQGPLWDRIQSHGRSK